MQRERRIRKRVEFKRVYNDGVRVPSRYMVVFALPREGYDESEQQTSRIGVTVTKRVGKAVVRARCRRRIKELFRQWYTEGSIPCDIVVNARNGCEEAPWQELVKHFIRSTAEAGKRLRRGMTKKAEGRTDVG